MRTLEEANNLIFVYKQQLQTDDIDHQYVVTADSMTVNKNPRNGRYEISKIDLPTVFDNPSATWRRNKEASKNNLMKFKVVKYDKWLKNEISKLESLVNASNVAQGDTSEDIVDVVDEIEDEHEEIITDIVEKTDIVEQEAQNSIYNITQIINKKCPIGSNNCLCCIYCDNIKLVNHICSIECTYKTE